jgi:hypothetical protein
MDIVTLAVGILIFAALLFINWRLRREIRCWRLSAGIGVDRGPGAIPRTSCASCRETIVDGMGSVFFGGVNYHRRCWMDLMQSGAGPRVDPVVTERGPETQLTLCAECGAAMARACGMEVPSAECALCGLSGHVAAQCKVVRL